MSIPASPAREAEVIRTPSRHRPISPVANEGSPVILPYVKRSTAKEKRLKNREMKEDLVM